MRLKELEQAITQLSRSELDAFSRWSAPAIESSHRENDGEEHEPASSPFLEGVETAQRQFDAALGSGDARAAVKAVLELDELMVAWANELQLGNWFGIDHNGATTQVQYVWRSERKQLHLFAARGGRSYLIQAKRLEVPAHFLEFLLGLARESHDDVRRNRHTRDSSSDAVEPRQVTLGSI